MSVIKSKRTALQNDNSEWIICDSTRLRRHRKHVSRRRTRKRNSINSISNNITSTWLSQTNQSSIPNTDYGLITLPILSQPDIQKQPTISYPISINSDNDESTSSVSMISDTFDEYTTDSNDNDDDDMHPIKQYHTISYNKHNVSKHIPTSKNKNEYKKLNKNCKKYLRKKERVYFRTVVTPKKHGPSNIFSCKGSHRGLKRYVKFWDFIENHDQSNYKHEDLCPMCGSINSDLGSSGGDFDVGQYKINRTRNKDKALKNKKRFQKCFIEVEIRLCSHNIDNTSPRYHIYALSMRLLSNEELLFHRIFAVEEYDFKMTDLNVMSNLYKLCQIHFVYLIPIAWKIKREDSLFNMYPDWKINDEWIIDNNLDICDMFCVEYNLPLEISKIICDEFLEYNQLSRILISAKWITRISNKRYKQLIEYNQTQNSNKVHQQNVDCVHQGNRKSYYGFRMV